MACAASALARASGDPVALDQAQPISGERRRNFIARARACRPDGQTRSVIVKMTRSPHYDPAAEKAFANFGLIREWSATAFIDACAPGRGHSPALLGGDVARGLIVFEDLGTGLRSLDHVLLEGPAAEAERALTHYATALGRLHADTVACAEGHRARFQSIFGGGEPSGSMWSSMEDSVSAIARKLGGTPPARELAQLSARLDDPGWQSLTHGDPCPDNALIVDDRIRLVDYEFARPAHALLDGIYWRIGFPTCWCAGRIPDDVARRVDRAYRAEIVRAMPAACDEAAYRTEIAHVAAIWLIRSLSWRLDRALEEDERWGTWSVRGRLLWYLEAVIEMTEAAHALPGFRATAHAWLAGLCKRWPDAAPLGLYRAFAPPRA
jgi:hypothetical protein